MRNIIKRGLIIGLSVITFFSVFLAIYFMGIKKSIAQNGEQLVWGTVTDSNTRTQQSDYDAIKNSANYMTGDVTAWRNDTVYSRILLWTKESPANNVTVSVGEFKNSKNDVFPLNSVEVSFIHDTNDHMYGVDVADVIWNSTKENMNANSLKSVWVTFNVPKEARVGDYVGNITVTCDNGSTLTFTYTIEVIGLTREEGKNNGVSLEHWLYPYSVDRYYSGKTSDDYFYGITTGDGYLETNRFNVADYVDRLYNIRLNWENESIYRAHINAYAEAGGTAITATCQEDPWGSQCPDPYPSMIKWIKKTDGTWKFDYTDFDRWVQLNLDYGVDKQIKVFSIASWTGLITYFDQATNAVKVDSIPISQENLENWKAVWTPFVKDFMAHTKEKGWFDITYIAIDERELEDVKAVLDLVESITDGNGKHFKTSLAVNWNGAISQFDRIDDLSIAYQLPNQHNFTVEQWAEERRNRGQMTTIYTCGSQCNALINSPAESVFCMMLTEKFEVDGFLRWAFDSFNLDPLADGSGSDHPTGDLFIIYPSDVTDTAGNVRSSVRFDKMSEGLRLMSKIKTIRNYSSAMSAEIDNILDSLTVPYYEAKDITNAQTNEKFNYYSIVGYVDKTTGQGVYGTIDFVGEVSNALNKINDLARKIALQNLIDEARSENSPSLATAISTAESARDSATTSQNLIDATLALQASLDTYNANEIAEISANDVVGWTNNATPTWDTRGAKMTITGGDWSQNGRINNNGKLNWMFNIQNNKTVSFKFKLGMKEAGAESVNKKWDSSNFFIIVRDVNNLGDELFRIRANINNIDGKDNPVEAIAETTNGAAGAWEDTVIFNRDNYCQDEGEKGTWERWVTGAPRLDSEYYFAFNATDLMLATYNGNSTLRPIVANVGEESTVKSGAWFYKTVKAKMANTYAVCFDIQGDAGFTKNVDLIVTEINGQSLSNDGDKLTTGGLTTTLGETEAFMSLGFDYPISSFKAKHIWQDDGGVSYSISWTGGATQAKTSGVVFKPTVNGLYNVTLYAEHTHFGSSTESFSIYVIDMETFGASIRYSDGSFRFNSRINKADYDYLISQGYTVNMGMVIKPTGLGVPLYGDENTLSISATNTTIESGYIYFNGVITAMPANERATDLNGRVYMSFIKGSETHTEYGVTLVRSFDYVVDAVLNDTRESRTGKYVNQVTIKGQTKWSPYTQQQIDRLVEFQG